MAGHSKWHKVKHQKAARDPKRAKIIARHIKEIEVAARQNPDPSANPGLSQAINKAKQDNVPKDNIQAAIDRAAGKEAAAGEAFTYAAFTPKGAALIITGSTDNKNRTLNEIRQVLKKAGGAIAELKAALWQFEKKEADGAIVYKPKVPAPLDEPAKQKLNQLVENLKAIPEIEAVFTNAA